MPRPDASEERIAQIIEAALTVFARDGFAQARIDDIAKTAGLGKGTVYLYFASKDAIIASILKVFFRQEMRLFQNYHLTEAPVREQLLHLTRALAGAIDRMHPLLPIAFEFYAIAGRRSDVRQFMVDSLLEYRTIMAGFIQTGVTRGEFRPCQPESVALTLIATFEGLTLFWLVAPQEMDWKQQAEAAVSQVLDGLRVFIHENA